MSVRVSVSVPRPQINANKPHFQSPHSWVGLSMVGGYAAAYVAAWAQMLVPFHFNKVNTHTSRGYVHATRAHKRPCLEYAEGLHTSH